MQPATLHYIYDPLCGWCYGAAPLLKAASAVPGLQIELHAGGMMAGSARQPGSPQLQGFVRPHAQRITRLTGQEFGPAYLHELTANPEASFDSEPPITAVLAATGFGAGIQMLEHLQDAHFRRGANIGDPAVILALARDLELTEFEARYRTTAGTPTLHHIQASRTLLHKLGGSGFPTYGFENPDGWRVLNSAAYLGQPERWAGMLAQLAI